MESRVQGDAPSLAPARSPEEGKRANVASNVNRLSVGEDGRLYWDDKPVVIRRRLLLTGWQKVGTIVVILAAFIIAISGAVHVAISAHDWMCAAKWVTGYCAPPASTPPSGPSPRPDMPN
jgi:hypothetical protein